MSRDVLSLAARALREESDEPASTVADTRARVIAAVGERRARRLSLVRIILPIAAVLIGSTAFASATGRLPAIAVALGIERAQPVASVAIVEATPPPIASPAMTVVEVAPPPVAPDEQAPVEHPAAAPREAPKPVAVRRAARAAPSVAATASAAPAEADPDYDLYLAAHRLHFVDHAPAAALKAWDDYLRAAPRGRFAPEAHYNRALCLVRLGRRVEAEAALDPFAKGSYGGYREAEARSLLDALHRSDP